MAFWNQGGADFSNLKPALMPEEMGDVQEPDGFWESTGDAVQAGLMTTGTAAWQLATVPAIGADWVKSKATGVDSTEYQDAMFSSVVDPAVQYVDSLSHRERTMAGSLSFGIGKVLTEFAGGGAPSMAVAEFSGRASSEIRAGNSVMDANMLALNQAAWAYAGARLPGALGGSLKTKIATGAGINVVAGIGQRATEYGLMTMQGDARAADISVFGFQDMLVDAVLGAAFGPLDSVRTKGMDMPDGKAIDGAMLMDRARFEDVQVGVRAPDVMAKVDRGIAEQVRAMQENRPALVERLPDEVTMPSRDGLFAKVGSEAYRENLRAWMGDSKVVDENGSPLVVYHGTAGDFDSFDTGRSGSAIDAGKLGEGLYFTQDPGWAEGYAKNAARNGGNAKILPVHLSLKNPLVFDDVGNLWAKLRKQSEEWGIREDPVLNEDNTPNPAWSKQFTKKAQQLGFDGVQLTSRFKQTEYVVFSKEQIKSAIGNSGRFDIEGGSLTDLVDATELDAKLKNMPADEIASALGIKPDPDMKAMQAEITTLRDSQVDLSQPIVPDVDPAAVSELRAQAQAIEAERGAANDPDVTEATAFADRVKSIREVMGCLLRIGA